MYNIIEWSNGTGLALEFIKKLKRTYFYTVTKHFMSSKYIAYLNSCFRERSPVDIKSSIVS